MRLLENEIEIIKRVILERIPDAKIYLYGSRADGSLKGGDIDLFVVFKPMNNQNTVKLKIEIEAEISKLLRYQKIDLTLLAKNNIPKNIFFKNTKKIKINN